MLGRLLGSIVRGIGFLFSKTPLSFQLKVSYWRSLLLLRELGPHAKAVLTETYNGRLLVSAPDVAMGGVLGHHGEYNREEIEFHLGHLTRESRVLIVGTHVGAVLVPLARRVRQVVGIEPNPDSYRFARMNLLLNDLTNVELNNWAASDKEGEAEFVFNTHNAGGSKLLLGRARQADHPYYRYDRPTVGRVRTRRLDDAIENRDFDLILVDVEGAEYIVLSGMADLMRRAKCMQLEIGQLAFRDIAEVTPQQLAGLIEPHFDEMFWTREPARRARKGEFGAFMERLCATGVEIKDVIFVKEGYLP